MKALKIIGALMLFGAIPVGVLVSQLFPGADYGAGIGLAVFLAGLLAFVVARLGEGVG